MTTLLVAMLGFFVVALDAQSADVALPDIGSSLAGGLSGLQWVVMGYTLTFASLLLFAGTLSDRVGARRAYGLGMAIFVLASALCGLSGSLAVLVAARVAQGVGAALITPTSLALIREAYQRASTRAKAVAYWALGGSVAAAAGPVLGGVLTQVSWRSIFWVNLPEPLLPAARSLPAADWIAPPAHDRAGRGPSARPLRAWPCGSDRACPSWPGRRSCSWGCSPSRGARHPAPLGRVVPDGASRCRRLVHRATADLAPHGGGRARAGRHGQRRVEHRPAGRRIDRRRRVTAGLSLLLPSGRTDRR